jgi:endonuclease III
MKKIGSMVEDIAKIYEQSGGEAEKYLSKARKLEEIYGCGPAVVYCWFYSVPQKWTQVEPKIFELMKYTKAFDLDIILSTPQREIRSIIRPIVFYNQISLQLRNFCSAIKSRYSSWDLFARVLTQESIFTIFRSLRSHRNVRVTFKNLSAMKIFVGMDNDLLIIDTHVAKVMGIGKKEISKYRTQKKLFSELLEIARNVTRLLKRNFGDVTMAKWSLAIWFDKAKILSDELLLF